MNLYFIFSLLILTSVYFCEASVDSRIILGNIARPGQFPWHASIHIIREPPAHIQYCGGSLIAQNFILTTAQYINQSAIEHARIELGSIIFSEPRVVMESRQFFVHPEYNPSRDLFDVGLIQLPQSVRYTFDISPIYLPRRREMGENFEKVEGIVSGFGVAAFGSAHLSKRLRFAPQRIISNAKCSETYGVGLIMNGNVLCAIGTRYFQLACYGDNGGALVAKRYGRSTQIGLVSTFPDEGCGSGLPVLYTKITAALDWISLTANVPIWP